MLPAILLSGAIFTALFVQISTSWLAGAWLPLLLFGCISAYNPKGNGGLIWWAALAWLIVIVACIFFINPVVGASYTMWVLAAMPIIALSMSPECLKGCLLGALVILTIFALGLIAQMIFHAQPSQPDILVHISYRAGYAYAWPMVDPNNAACVLNFGLIPCFWLGMKDRRWLALTAIFAFAHIATASKAGCSAATVGCAVVWGEHYSRKYDLAFPLLMRTLLAACIGIFLAPWEWITPYLGERPEMWAACLKMISASPWVGFGAGTFPSYYAQFRTEHINGGYYAHNDILQLAVELGIPASLGFLALCIMIACQSHRKNIPAAAVLLATFLQAMVEFQFYVPVISILAGLAVAYHRLTYCDNRNIMAPRRQS